MKYSIKIIIFSLATLLLVANGSVDGINWTQATASAAWVGRETHTSLTYDNKIWVMGGWGNGGVHRKDVWYSTDGVNWVQATSVADWPSRRGHLSVAHDNKMWILGGRDGPNSSLGDIWHTTK